MQFIIAILIIGIIIMFHEFGHFIAAKACGVGVVEFALGMGPLLLHKRMGETVYSIRAIPVGGFCAMYGEQSMEAEGTARGADFKSDWAPERSFDACRGWQRLAIALAGPGFNMLMAFVALVLVAAISGPKYGPVEVVELGTVTVAQDAGVEVGDILMEVDGRKIVTAQSYSSYLDTHPRKRTDGYALTVYRPSDGSIREFFLVPEYVESEGRNIVGITYKSQDQEGPFVAVGNGWRLLQTYAMMSVDSVAMLLRGDAGLRDLSGVIGITAAVGDIVEEAAEAQEAMAEETDDTAVARAILSMTALISVSLGVMNLLPLPALDGGRSLITVGEMLVGKRMPKRAEAVINGVCMIVLMCLMGVVMAMDVVRLVQGILA